jgi:EpsI family protein
MSWNTRFLTVVLLLGGAALFLQARAHNPIALERISLAAFPVQMSNWVGTDVPIPSETLKTLGAGEFLQREYINDQTEQPDVTLYLAYRPTDYSFFHHLPPNCLTGSGWTTLESGTTTVQFSGEPAFEANRYLIARGTDRQLVLFWYWAHGRRVARENRMNLYLILDSLRWNRSDNALIRLNTPLLPDEDQQQAEQRLLAFAGLVNPRLDRYIPR